MGESKTEIEEDSPVEDTDAMTIDEKSEIGAKVAEALEANFETHDMVARAHSGENGDEESEDEMMQREEEEKSGEGIGSEEKMDTEVGNLELAWQMFEFGQGYLQQGWQPYQGVRVLDPPGRGEFGEL